MDTKPFRFDANSVQRADDGSLVIALSGKDDGERSLLLTGSATAALSLIAGIALALASDDLSRR